MENLYGYRLKEMRDYRVWFRNKGAREALPKKYWNFYIPHAWAVDNMSVADWGPHCFLGASEMLHRASQEEKTRLVNWSDLLYWAHDYVLKANYAVRSGIVFA